jgi:hypothetical protein
MTKLKHITAGLIASGLLLLFSGVQAQDNLRLGAYYFDGWSGKTAHLSQKLKNDFPERKPVWGWQTGTPQIIEKQIDLAHKYGIQFFSFCWYYNPVGQGKDVDDDPKNNALNLYLQAANKSKLDFTILVANHSGYTIKADDWPALCRYWIKLFRDPSFVRVDQKPLITFFDVASLVSTFGSSQRTAAALDTLRLLAREQGLNGVSIAANVGTTSKSIELAGKCGFDIFTGYNYHSNGLAQIQAQSVAIDSMRTRETKVWDNLVSNGSKPIIPVVTLNWDNRPWDKDGAKPSARFSGYSKVSVENAVRSCRHWMSTNKHRVVSEHIAVLYAWNEYGEGAWLTPSKALKNTLLEGLRKGLSN